MLTNRFTLAKNAVVVLFLVVSALLFTVPSALADEAQAKSSGILPLPDYSGDFAKRSYLLGDFGGKRTEWAKKGVTFNLDYNQYFQAVTDGGIDTDSEYGGTIDYNINVDFDRMGLIPGGLLQIRAVSRYGDSVNSISGSLIPVNTDATHPTTSTLDDDVGLWLPVINYTQFLSDTFALGFGKYDTYDSANEFAGGRGRSQWWNMNLNMPVSPALIIPYSILGGVALYMPNPNMTITGMVATSTDTSNSSGFDNFDDAMFGLLSLSNQYQISSLPGGFGLMYGYGWDGNFNEINGRINIDQGQLTPSTKDSTWFFSADFWQYLWVEGDASQPVDSTNGRQDLQGVGVFFRVQFADKDTNPFDYIISAGVNAKGLIPGRDNDSMGLGFSYNSFQSARFLNALGIDDTSSVVELFYNIELTPALHLNLDAQVADSALPDIDTATILGACLQIRF
ncbi:carbohydrate porin [Desulfobacula sp.]|uniref:carbohydrate porin n=1 Tax=Desulfobacula sp. TaxID=2593537 RepID=UPI002608B118|nr:carbohydrate porin [Desulfobacula sp.]